MNLWLDDLRPPPGGGWHWVKTADEAIDAMQTCDVEFASLDHDLGDVCMTLTADEKGDLFYEYNDISMDEFHAHLSHKEKTGYDVVLWMAEHDVWPANGILVHSWNPVGAERMCSVINHQGPYDKAVRSTPDKRMWTELDGTDNREDRPKQGKAT